MKMTPASRQTCSLSLTALLTFGLLSALAAQPPTEKRYQIRKRSETFVASHPLAPAPNDDPLRALQKERLGAALGELLNRTSEFLQDGSRIDALIQSELRVLDAELDYYADPAERIRMLEGHLEIGRDLEGVIEQRSKSELATATHVEFSRYFRARVQVALLNAKRDAAREPKRAGARG